MGSQKFDHITPELCDLHWLPVRQRIKYKLAMIVYKCLHGLAPVYLVSDCQAISAIASKRHLRSADTGTLFVPRTTTTLGMRSFAVAGSPHIGTVCQLPFEPQCSRLCRSLDISRPTCLTWTDSVSKDYLGCALQIC